jgi:hypothetical protein
MEYTALPGIIDRFQDRWEDAESHGSQADGTIDGDVE